MTAGLFAQRTGLGWTVGSCVRLVWSSAAGKFEIICNSGAHNLGVVSRAYFVKQGGEGLKYFLFYRGECTFVSQA